MPQAKKSTGHEITGIPREPRDKGQIEKARAANVWAPGQ